MYLPVALFSLTETSCFNSCIRHKVPELFPACIFIRKSANFEYVSFSCYDKLPSNESGHPADSDNSPRTHVES